MLKSESVVTCFIFFIVCINLQHFCWYLLLSFFHLILVHSTDSVGVGACVAMWKAR